MKYIHHSPEVNPVPPPRPAWRRSSSPRLDHRAQRGDGADIVAIRNAQSYLFRKVGDPEGLPTILFDEIDTVFGPKPKTTKKSAAYSTPAIAAAPSPAAASYAANSSKPKKSRPTAQ